MLPGFRPPPPPSGSNAAPKLLQYAYQKGLSPVCMGEFCVSTGKEYETQILLLLLCHVVPHPRSHAARIKR